MMLKNEELNPTILPLTIDGIFKMYFEDPKNLPELRRFLKAHLDLGDSDLSTIEVLNPGLPKDNIEDKGFTVDLLLKTNSNNDIHIEMQTNSHQSFKERVQLYNARKAGQQVKAGQDYRDAKRTISLIVTDFRVFADSEDYHETVMMRRKNGKVFTSVQEINIIDLTKLGTEEANDREKYLWGKLFKVQTKEELEMLAKESEEMAQAVEKLLEISADERAQAYALSRDNADFARRLHEHGIRKKATAEGHAEGLEQGLEQGRLEIARKMLAKGMPVEDVLEITNFPVERIEKLKNEL